MGEAFVPVKAALAVAGGVLSAIFGGFDAYLELLLLVMLIDIVTGVLRAIEEKNVSSAVMRKGLLNKVVILLLVALGVVVDSAFSSELAGGIKIGEFTLLIRNCVIFWFCIEEGISVCENCAKLGVPMPKVLKQVLECIESGVSNSTPSDVLNFLKKTFGINVSFGKDRRTDKTESSDDFKLSEETKISLSDSEDGKDD